MHSVGQAHLGFIILVNKKTNTEAINHESIHIVQQRELLVVFWYLLYVLMFLWEWFKIFKFWKAYRNIILEKEAYAHEKDNDYLKKRRFFAWVKCLL